jgi:adenine phosphoribosyltransferase
MTSTALDLQHAIRNVANFPKAGIQFKDITPILVDPVLLNQAVDALAAPYFGQGITKVVAIEARGFILGGMLACRLGAGFVPVRKKGKLPYRTLVETYALEYGTDTIEMHEDAVSASDRVLIHDDVIATGGTAVAAHRLVKQAGADVVGYAFLIELDFLQGRRLLGEQAPVHVVIHG